MIDNAAGTVKLTLTMDLNPADGDLDGRTSIGDLIVWSQNRFQENMTFTRGDYDGDGRTGIGDLITWSQNRFTQASAPAGAPAAAPVAAEAGAPPAFIYDPETGIMSVEAGENYIATVKFLVSEDLVEGMVDELGENGAAE